MPDDETDPGKGILPIRWVQYFQRSLVEIFDRKDAAEVGIRTDMTKAAQAFKRQGSTLLEDGAGMAADSSKRFLTEIEAGRWHGGLNDFEMNGTI